MFRAMFRLGIARIRVTAAGVGLLGALWSCSDAIAPLWEMPVPAPTVASVSVNPSTASVMIGGTQQLTATARDGAGNVLGRTTFSWSSSDESKATVSPTGLVTAISAGAATITATCEGRTATSSIVIAATPPCSLAGEVGHKTPAAFAPPVGSVCQATDVISLRMCVARLRSGNADLLRIDGVILCSGPDACRIDLEGVRDLTIFGGTPASGLRRVDSYTSPLVDLNGASNVTVANLTLDEGPEAPACDPVRVNGVYTYPCQSTIAIERAERITLDRVRLHNAKNHGVTVSASRDVVIKNSEIVNAAVFGVWTGSSAATATTKLLIENNSIADVRSNGLYLSFTDSATVRRNTFRHNHRVALFEVCGGRCSGGQIDVLEDTNLSIDSNRIVDGVIDRDDAVAQAWGIEMNGNLRNVTIANNEIANNRGAGIVATLGAMNLENVAVTRNRLYRNGVAFAGMEGTSIRVADNCTADP